MKTKSKQEQLTTEERALAIIWERLAADLDSWDFGFEADPSTMEKVGDAYRIAVMRILRPVEERLSKSKSLHDQTWPHYSG